jgi:plasmid stability protein
VTQIFVPDVSEELCHRLQVRARSHGRTLEEEAREILQAAVDEAPPDEPGNLGSRIARHFADMGFDEPIKELRGWSARPAEFD